MTIGKRRRGRAAPKPAQLPDGSPCPAEETVPEETPLPEEAPASEETAAPEELPPDSFQVPEPVSVFTPGYYDLRHACTKALNSF